jgi:hypothetical protein
MLPEGSDNWTQEQINEWIEKVKQDRINLEE